MKVEAYSHSQGEKCDFLSFDKCDPYVKILVNSELVYVTRTVSDGSYVIFDETFTTKRIEKNSMITIEVWDYDKMSNSDLILRWEVSVENLLKTNLKRGYGDNKVYVNSWWADEK